MQKMNTRKQHIRKISAVLLAVLLLTTISACGKAGKEDAAKLEGSCEEILNQLYENASLDEGLRDVIEQGYYDTIAIDESNEEYLLGTTEVNYTDSACSIPFANATAYQCIVLRVDENQDVTEAKQLLIDNADPIKWICVEAESVVVENVGDVVLYIMADQETADAIKTAFLALGES